MIQRGECRRIFLVEAGCQHAHAEDVGQLSDTPSDGPEAYLDLLSDPPGKGGLFPVALLL